MITSEETEQQEERWRLSDIASTGEERWHTVRIFGTKSLKEITVWRIYAMQELQHRNTLPPLRKSRRSGVFSVPNRAEVCPAMTSPASPRFICCQATAINSWMTQEWGGVTWQRQQWRHAFQQWRNNWSIVGRSVCRVSDHGRDWSSFMGEFSVADSCGRFVVGEDLIVWIGNWKCDMKALFVLQWQ
jgi:hypothetical protein